MENLCAVLHGGIFGTYVKRCKDVREVLVSNPERAPTGYSQVHWLQHKER